MKRLTTIALIVLIALAAHATSAPQLVDHWWQAMPTIHSARVLQTSVEAYWADHNRYPAAKDMDELEDALSPVYVKEMPEKDEWGTEFVYEVSKDGQSYTIASAGSDKKFARATWTAPAFSVHSADDLVYRNGDFAREWVIQRVCK